MNPLTAPFFLPKRNLMSPGELQKLIDAHAEALTAVIESAPPEVLNFLITKALHHFSDDLIKAWTDGEF